MIKKFSDAEIYGVDTEPIVGGRLGDWMRQLMRNQNEIIEWMRATHPKSADAVIEPDK